MAQTSPPNDPDVPSPLRRRPAPRPGSPARAGRPRFQALDALWIVVLCLISLAMSAWMGEMSGRRLGGLLAADGTVAALYLLGWKARDRAAGVSAALLAALSPQFLFWAAYSPESASFALLCLAALFVFVAGSSLAALALAGGAAMVRPDGLLLGLLLLGLSLAQHRRRTLFGAALFVVPVAAFEAGRILLGYGTPRLPIFGLHFAVWHWLGLPASALLAWMLLPLCAEMSETQRRSRWLPMVLWTLILLVSTSSQSVTTPTGMLLPLLPLVFALAGGGLSRLLPTLAGEFPSPALRYLLATLAVLGMVGLHWRLEPHIIWPVNSAAATELRSR